MSAGVVLSPNRAIIKTRNAILRMKKCSPELRTVLRQRCQERIHNDRLKILSSFRKTKIQENFKNAFGNILKEEWKNLDEVDSAKLQANDLPPDLGLDDFTLDENLQLEELLEKELLLEHEDWLFQLYEELLNEDLKESTGVVCPLCCLGYLNQVTCQTFYRTSCTKCPANFIVQKSLMDLQAAIYECLAWHDKQCDYRSSFAKVPKNESENNLCILCHHCLHLKIIE